WALAGEFQIAPSVLAGNTLPEVESANRRTAMPPFGGPPTVWKLEVNRNVPGLIEALRYTQDPSVRQNAALALGRIQDARAVGPLAAALQDTSIEVRMAAAESLEAIMDAHPDFAGLQPIGGKALGATGDAYVDSCFFNDLEESEDGRDWRMIPEAKA